MTGGSEGFTELTTTNGEKAYALIIPGIGLVAAPGPFEWVDHGDGSVQDLQYLSKHPAIFGISKAASCDDLYSNLPFQFVVVLMPKPNWNSQIDWAAASGTVTFNVATSKYEAAVQFYTLDGNKADNFIVEGDCNNGIISFDVGASEPARVSFTPSGTFFVDDPSQGGMVGFKSDSAVTIEEVYGKSFLGTRYHSNYEYLDSTSSPETQPFKTTIAQDGTSARLDFFKDIASGETEFWSDVPISFGAQIEPGMFKGTLTDADGEHDAIYIARKINGRYQVIAITDNWPSYKGYNLFMLEK